MQVRPRPSPIRNLAPLLGGLPILAILWVRSGGWWIVGIVTAVVTIQATLWVLAPYKEWAWRALDERVSTAEHLDPWKRKRGIGWVFRLGGLTMGEPWRTKSERANSDEERHEA